MTPLKQRLAALGIPDPKALVESMTVKGKLSRGAIAVDWETIARRAQEREAKRKARGWNGRRIPTRKGWIKPISSSDPIPTSEIISADEVAGGATRPPVTNL